MYKKLVSKKNCGIMILKLYNSWQFQV